MSQKKNKSKQPQKKQNKPENIIWEAYNWMENELHPLTLLFGETGTKLAGIYLLQQVQAEARANKKGIPAETEFRKSMPDLFKKFEKEINSVGKKEETIGKNAINKAVERMNEGLEKLYPADNLAPTFDLSAYSDRVWKNKEKLLESLKKDVQTGMRKGQDSNTMARQIQKRTGQESNYNAYRLARTENMKALNTEALNRYRSKGYTLVQEVVTQDERTSDECLEHVGLVWRIDDPDRPTLPRRPNCRCTWAPLTENKHQGFNIAKSKNNAPVIRENLKVDVIELKQNNNSIIDVTVEEREIKEKLLLIEANNPFYHLDDGVKIKSGRQRKHIKGTKEFNDYLEKNGIPPSYLTIDEIKINELIDAYHGFGILKLDKNNQVISSEVIIDNNDPIGYVIDNQTGKEIETTAFKIHYSKEGQHIVPTYPSTKEYFLKERENDPSNWLYRQKNHHNS